MRQSFLFTKTRKESPKDEVAKNAELLIKGGFIHKEMSGVYSLLPLGLRVIEKIRLIIKEEMNAIGGQEVSLSALQEKEKWEKTNRWDEKMVDNWFKTNLKNGGEVGLAFTHEEPLTSIMAEHITSHKDLPKFVYQFQTKFRNESRAKSGILRGREFLMKDLYSFCKDQKEQDDFYEKAKEAYVKIFERVGIGSKTYITFASGGSFSKYSHEFQTATEAGEDIIYVNETKKIAVNKEVMNHDVLNDLGLTKEDLKEKKTVEVGNIFNLGTKFSEALGFNFADIDGSKKPVFMGSYGIGLGRLMGTIVEVFHDEKGIIWPSAVSPFSVHLINLNPTDSEVSLKSDEIYESLKGREVDVLYDDRKEERAGEKFADSDLIGIPTRVVVSKKTLEGDSVEVKERGSDETELVNIEEFIESY